MWQLLLCFVAFINAAPNFSLEDSGEYHYRPFQYRVEPSVTQYGVAPVPLVKAFPVLKTFHTPVKSEHSVPKKYSADPQVEVTHVQPDQTHADKPSYIKSSVIDKPVFYSKFKYDFDDDDDDRFYVKGVAPLRYTSAGSPTYYKLGFDDDDDDRVLYSGFSKFRSAPTVYSGGHFRYYDDDLFDFDDK